MLWRQGGRLDAHLARDGAWLLPSSARLLAPDSPFASQLNDLQSGKYSDEIKEFLIIDCRFDYEYDGGHIEGAINLSELADVEARLLNAPNPPKPSTSESVSKEGKTVLVFHCEFSAKRAPTR